VVSVALGPFVNEPAIIPISTTPFAITPASTDALSFYQFHEYYDREMARQGTSIS
jgi:hypothetical protein